MKRVVITGISAITALGNCWDSFKVALEKGENAVVNMPRVAKGFRFKYELSSTCCDITKHQSIINVNKYALWAKCR